MSLLLVILFAAGAPVPPAPAPTFAIVPPSRTIALEWNNSTTPGTSNRLYSWSVTSTNWTIIAYTNLPSVAYVVTNVLYETNTFDVGETNLCFVNVDNTRRYYAVRAVVDGRESVPSNVVKYPGDVVREFHVVKPDGLKVGLGTFTNTPPGELGLWRLNVSEWVKYDEP